MQRNLMFKVFQNIIKMYILRPEMWYTGSG